MVKIRVKHATAALREHHEKILEAMSILNKLLENPNPPVEDVKRIIEFIQKFVDACHHGVEEYILFQGVNRAGFPFHGSPIFVMVSEHGVGRYLVRVMEELYKAWEQGDKSAYRDFVDYAKLYLDHISQHIEKENGILFPMLERGFHEVEASRSVEDFEREHDYDKWIRAIDELKQRYS